MFRHNHHAWRRLFAAIEPTRARRPRSVFACEGLEERRVPASLTPVSLAPADYNGDGVSEFAVFQPETSTFYIESLVGNGGNRAIQFGQGTLYGGNPIPIVADFNHDGTTELAVFQPSTSTFYIRQLYADGEVGNRAIQFGQGTLYGGNPIPVVADYNGDGRAEFAVFQPSTSKFYIRHMTEDTDAGNRWYQFGQGTLYGGDPVPVVADYNDDGKAELVVYQPSTSTFFLNHLMADDATGNRAIQFGTGTNQGGHPMPVLSDLNGDRKVELIVYDTRTLTYKVANLVGDQPRAAYDVNFRALAFDRTANLRDCPISRLMRHFDTGIADQRPRAAAGATSTESSPA